MPPGPIMHALPSLVAKPLCLHAARLGSASRQTLERLIPKSLQILLHAESPALLFYREERRCASSGEKRNETEPQTSLIKRLRKRLQALKAVERLGRLAQASSWHRHAPAA